MRSVPPDPLDTPNCPADLTRMDLVGSDERPYWLCPVCGTVVLAG